MINIEMLDDNIVTIRVTGKLEESDFAHIGPQMDQIISSRGNIRLLIDATGFDGWHDMEAVKKHFSFVRDHHERIDQIALIAGHEWQHWIVGMAGIFVHPVIKVFDKGESAQAEAWLSRKRAA